MRIAMGALVVGVACTLMVAGMLFVRRRAPDGGYFKDGDRASGVFGVIATGFALLLGFVVFLAFTKYDESRAGAESEALLLVQQFETAQLMPSEVSSELSGELLCYGRSVVNLEWPAMQAGEDASSQINTWAISLFRTLETIEPEAASEQSAYDAWLAQTNAREEARRDRLHAADGIVPFPVWLILLLSASLTLAYMLFFADSGEAALVQGFMAGAVTAVIVTTLLVLVVLNRPYEPGVGGLRPVAMERSLEIVDEARSTLGLEDPPPCDQAGRPS